ncbi:MAG: ferric reductase-like transmembrane domain-containing protein [Pseudomonadota bacterium]
MAASYKIVTWTPFKKRFDLWLLVGIAVYLVTFILIMSLSQPVDETFTPIQMLMRAFGTLAFLLLSFILCIGPLARLTPRFKPFLYNRRHLGVTTFFVALFHAALSTLWYHGFSDVNPFLSIFVSNPRYDSIAGFPFESLGFVALFILFLMAATSHDFWNANLGPRLWKTLHMLVYLAYGLLVAHIALGAIQFEKDPIYVALLGGSAAIVAALHLLTALKPSGHITQAPATDWIEVGPAGDMVDAKARIIRPRSGEAIAVFRDGQTVAAVSHVCRHQGGPLGEGLVIDGCVTCPWHGFQYRLADGTSPPPFTEKVATYPTRIENGIVYVRAIPDPPGTPQTPSIIGAARV